MGKEGHCNCDPVKGLEMEVTLGRVLLPGWDQMVRSRRGLGPAGWAAILRILPAWGHLHKAYLLPPERPGEF